MDTADRLQLEMQLRQARREEIERRVTAHNARYGSLRQGVRSSTRDILKNIHRNSKGLMNYYNSSQIHFPRKLEPV